VERELTGRKEELAGAFGCLQIKESAAHDMPHVSNGRYSGLGRTLIG
jgi:hypothetical protein